MTGPTISESLSGSRRVATRDQWPLRSSPFRTTARVILILTLFGAPWAFGAVEPWAWGIFSVSVLLTLILWALACVHEGALELRWSPLYWPFMAYIAFIGFQLFAGITADRLATREVLLQFIANFVLFFLVGQLLLTDPEYGEVLEWWGLMATVLAFGLSLLAFAQLMTTGYGLIYWTIRTPYGPFGPYISANDYCGLLEMLLPVAVGYILACRFPVPIKLVLWGFVGVGLASIAVSGSRGGAAVVLIEMLLFAFIIFRRRPRGAGGSALPLVLALVLASGAIFVAMSHHERMSRSLSIFGTDKSVQVKLGDRLWVAKDTLRMARRHPLGIGAGTFETVFPSYMTHPSDLHWSHAHDDFAEALAETGLPGGVLMLWALVLFIRRALTHFRRHRRRHGWGWIWIPIGATVGAMGLLFHSLVDFNLRLPANAAWFAACVAIATQFSASPDPRLRVVRDSVSERNEE